MKIYAAPIVLLAVMFGPNGDFPAEGDMRSAFDNAMRAQVRGVVEFIAESQGHEAVERIMAAGTDRFQVRNLRKIRCARDPVGASHVCRFEVEVEVVGGTFQHTLEGRFIRGQSGVKFRQEI
ncbi:MAG: hypothetical protein HY056_17450 [Proteobacteria bacterium]|nr:hypothetical protein [Pseudomonadota bacterium]